MDGTVPSSAKSEALKPKRRQWSVEERQKIVKASLKAGTTVDAVARLYGVNASQIYDWRKQHRQKMQADKGSVLLPVQMAGGASVVMPDGKQECSVVIEARSVRVAVSGAIDEEVIRAVLECLAR